MKFLTFVAVLINLPALANAHDILVGELAIGHPYILPTTASAMTGAGYFTLTNLGLEDDRLVTIEADFPRVMMHDMQVADGIATMMHLADGVVVPAGESVEFAPRGKHVMFMGLNGDPFEVGEEIPAIFTFEKAGSVNLVFSVEETGSTH